jgi:hypothetical protein
MEVMHLLGMTIALIAAVTMSPSNRPDSVEVTLPPITEVQQRAVEISHLDIQEAAKWKHKATMAAFVPRIQLDYGHRMRNYVNVNVNDNVYVGASGVAVGPQDGTYSCNQSADNSYGVRAIWELRDVVFNTQVLAASAEARNITRDRNALLAEISKRYYEIENTQPDLALLAQLVPLNPRKDKALQDIFTKKVSCEESVAQLDALTGGWFKSRVEGSPCEPRPASKKEGRR